MKQKQITKKQYEELIEARSVDKKEFHRLLEKYAGIEARAYTGYQYFDSAGNYIGDDCTSDIWDILDSAYFGIGD